MALQVASGMLLEELPAKDFTDELFITTNVEKDFKGLKEWISTNVEKDFNPLEWYKAKSFGPPVALPASAHIQVIPAAALLDAVGVMQLAKVRIEKHGWSQGRTYGPDGSMCLGAALGLWTPQESRMPMFLSAVERVATTIRPILGGLNPDPDSAIAHYNDRIARKRQDVFDVLDKTISVTLAELAESV